MVNLSLLWLPWLLPLVCELIDRVWDRYAVNVPLWCAVPAVRVVQWGEVEREYGPDRYFQVKLPSWDWQTTDYRNRWCWHQLHIVWTSRLGWFLEYVPCTRGPG